MEYLRKMFPMTLAYALTSYKVQGETFDGGVIVDYTDGWIQKGSFYVAITRVKSSDKLFLRSFDISFVKFNYDIEAKISSMRSEKPYEYKKVYLDENVFKLDQNDLKIGYLNVNGLFDSLHSECINSDHNL